MIKNLNFRVIVLPCMLAMYCWTLSGRDANASSLFQEHGRVSMQGSIIDTPCAIATPDLAQAIDMKTTTVGEVIDNGHGQTHPFSVTLVNCDLSASSSDLTHFRTTFDGPADDGLFSISGAGGVSLQIADAAGNIATPGQALPEGHLASGTQRLDYTLRLVRNHYPLKPGTYNAAVRFKVDYF